MQTSKKCPNCGEICNERYCSYCGEKLEETPPRNGEAANTETYAETTSSQTEVDRDYPSSMPPQQGKKDTAMRWLAIILIPLMAIGFSVFYFLYSTTLEAKPASTGEALLPNHYIAYDGQEAYAKKYLVRVGDADSDEIECFLDPYEDKNDRQHVVTVANYSEYFFKGTVKLTSTRLSDSKTLTVPYLPPNDYSYYLTSFSRTPQAYEIEGSYYRFTYPKPDLEYDYSYGGEDDEFWINFFLYKQDMPAEQLLQMAEYYYIVFAITGQPDDVVLYFYDIEGDYEEDEDGYLIAETAQALFATELSFSDKRITLYEMKDGLVHDLQSKEML